MLIHAQTGAKLIRPACYRQLRGNATSCFPERSHFAYFSYVICLCFFFIYLFICFFFISSSLLCFSLFSLLHPLFSTPPSSVCVIVVSTLQYKVSSPPSHPSNTPPEYRHYRAATLPPSYARVASNSSPSSSSSSSSQEREVLGGRAGDNSAQLSQLSTSLASAFSPVQPGVPMAPTRQVRQIPLSPPTARALHHTQSLHQGHGLQDPVLPPKHGTWSASHTHMYGPVPSTPPLVGMMPVHMPPVPQPQHVVPVAHPLPPLHSHVKTHPLDQPDQPHIPSHLPHANGQSEDYYNLAQQQQQQLGYGEATSLPPLIGQSAQGPVPVSAHQSQYPSSFHPQQQMYQATPPPPPAPQFSPPSYTTAQSEGGSPKQTTSPVTQAATASCSKYKHSSMSKALGQLVCVLCVCRGGGLHSTPLHSTHLAQHAFGVCGWKHIPIMNTMNRKFSHLLLYFCILINFKLNSSYLRLLI